MYINVNPTNTKQTLYFHHTKMDSFECVKLIIPNKKEGEPDSYKLEGKLSLSGSGIKYTLNDKDCKEILSNINMYNGLESMQIGAYVKPPKQESTPEPINDPETTATEE